MNESQKVEAWKGVKHGAKKSGSEISWNFVAIGEQRDKKSKSPSMGSRRPTTAEREPKREIQALWVITSPLQNLFSHQTPTLMSTPLSRDDIAKDL